MPLKSWCSIHARWSKSSLKNSIRFCGILPSLKQNFIAYRFFKVPSRPDCIFEIDQLWQSGFSRVYSNSCCSSSFKPEIIKISQPSHNIYSNNIVNFQESKTILNACTNKVWKLIEGTTYMHNPASVQENDTYKLLWDYEIKTDHLIYARRPDLIKINKKRKDLPLKKPPRRLAKLWTLLFRQTTE